ncbi:MAG: hypothetical protein J0I77_22065 [Rudaea sp.]|uniref:hypothetical protein n=1 Tax=Rudaea sp. TaxID=2136325 RepID=UPI001ACDB5AF|nr:hypothetical protein [Rudaea sp.]MBN8888414.1 hypothetical protein [Rudaea sp.]MBR0347199.1 hypothetical protein [Rudaea sp.]
MSAYRRQHFVVGRMSIWRPKSVVLISVTRVFLLAAIIHLGQIIYGGFVGVDDGSTFVGFPFVFASWSGGVCFGTCSTFRAASLLGTLAFWAALASGTAYFFLIRRSRRRHDET